MSITFNHFFARKVMLAKYATPFVFIPGGLGTLDELTEVLTLIQTHKMKPFPVLLYNGGYWKGFLDWLRQTVLTSGCISEEDLDLLRICEKPETIVEAVQRWYQSHEIIGQKVTHAE